MSNEKIDSLIEETNPVDYVKSLAALTAAGLVGFILGINYIAGAAIKSLAPLEPAPTWIGQAELMQFGAMVCLAIVVVGWVYLDYNEVADD